MGPPGQRITLVRAFGDVRRSGPCECVHHGEDRPAVRLGAVMAALPRKALAAHRVGEAVPPARSCIHVAPGARPPTEPVAAPGCGTPAVCSRTRASKSARQASTCSASRSTATSAACTSGQGRAHAADAGPRARARPERGPAPCALSSALPCASAPVPAGTPQVLSPVSAHPLVWIPVPPHAAHPLRRRAQPLVPPRSASRLPRNRSRLASPSPVSQPRCRPPSGFLRAPPAPRIYAASGGLPPPVVLTFAPRLPRHPPADVRRRRTRSALAPDLLQLLGRDVRLEPAHWSRWLPPTAHPWLTGLCLVGFGIDRRARRRTV